MYSSRYWLKVCWHFSLILIHTVDRVYSSASLCCVYPYSLVVYSLMYSLLLMDCVHTYLLIDCGLHLTSFIQSPGVYVECQNIIIYFSIVIIIIFNYYYYFFIMFSSMLLLLLWHLNLPHRLKFYIWGSIMLPLDGIKVLI